MPGDRATARRRVTGLVLVSALVCLVAAVGATRRPVAHAAGRTHTVHIKNFVFDLARLEVQSGDTIVWANDDIVPHTATAKSGFDSKGIDPGRSWRFVAGSTGTFAYLCTFHPTMTGELVVR